ncbi:MAG: metallophosphoesterase [Planctomyces sp.]|jgi:predicted phosphodiesterase
MSKKNVRLILVLPDMHSPWINWAAVNMAHKWAKKHKPDLVVQLGDLADQKAWSRWPTDPDDPSPHSEFEAFIQDMHKLNKMFPKMHILTGNHDLRLRSRAAESKVPGRMLKTIQDVLPFKGWVWHLDPRDKLIVPTARGKILFVHGDEDGGTPIQKAVQLGVNICQGHTHRCSVVTRQTLDKFVWGMECGHLMDVESKAADYAARKSVGMACGFGVIKFGVPYWIPADGGDV